jgi:hypothetical protein
MAMELMLSHDFIEELARELEFDQGAYRHTADLNNGNVDISVDISTKCREPSAYAVSWGLRRDIVVERVEMKEEEEKRKKGGRSPFIPTTRIPSQNGHLLLPYTHAGLLR